MDQPSTHITADPTKAVVVPPKSPAKVPASDWTSAMILSAGLIAILAFFLGSYRPQNTDLWLTLATGKLISSGQYQFGVDPFSWASDGAFWANPSWLSSLVAYGIYTLFGGAMLVIVKALLIVALAGFLFAARTKDSPLLPSLELTALALLVASPRFFLQSLVISYVMLAALLYLFVRDGFLGGFAAGDKPKAGPMWRIPLLFLAWANLDGYFVLGLFAMAAIAIGLAVFADTRPDAKRLGAILGLSLIASILNPHLLANLTLPTDIAYLVRDVFPEAWTAAGRAAAALDQGDAGFYPMVSPFSSTAITGGGFNNNIAGLAFYLFLLVNVISFVACGFVPGTKATGARGLLCLTFGILGAFQIRLVPFYAIVAGPVTVLNFTDYARWARLKESMPAGGVKLAGWTTCFALAGLSFFAWPGWLHIGLAQFRDDAMFNSPRRVEWAFEPDPSLEQAAESLQRAKERGEIANVYNFAHDIAHYCAYFAPDVKCGIDQRFALFAAKAKDYAILRNDLWDQATDVVQPKEKRPPSAERVWPKMLADWKIDALAITGYHRSATGKTAPLAFTVQMMFYHPQMWKMAYGDGQTIVFDYSAASAFAVDAPLAALRKEAFAPQPESTWLPDNTPLIPPRELIWLDKYARGTGPTPLETNAAVFEMDLFLKYSGSWQDAYYVAFQSLHALPAAGHAGMVPGHVLGLNAAFLTRLGDEVLRRPAGNDAHWFRCVDLGPASLPILAQRNLRRSLDKNPNVAATHFWLAQNIRSILKEEAWWSRNQLSQTRTQLRQIEIAAALHSAVTLAPNNPNYQMQMAELLLSIPYFDAAVFHYQEAIKNLDLPKIPNPQQQQEIDGLVKRQKIMERELKRRMDDYELKSAGLGDMDRFRIAVVAPWRFTDINGNVQEDHRGRGLVLEALKVLNRINPDTLNEHDKAERAYFLIQLNCFEGKIHEAVEQLNKSKDDLGRFGPDCNLWIAAATGWYKNLDESLAFFENDVSPERQAPDIIRLVVPTLDQLLLLPHQPLAVGIHTVYVAEIRFMAARDIVGRALGKASELRTLRGIYALERGDVETARKHFDQALKVEVPFADRGIAERYRELLIEAAK